MIPIPVPRARVLGCPEAAVCYKQAMEREFSAGGVLVRRLRGRWYLAAIRPTGRGERTWALPKGWIDAGESPAETAVREAWEETGLHGRLEGKLGDVKYTYTRRDGTRVFKVVSFFLLRYRSGRIGAIPPGMEVEVAEARWLLLEEAPRLLAYGGERQMAAKALALLGESGL
jgi:8-oxo-dGTP pyrophosphatase MutT (NUDIX family)